MQALAIVLLCVSASVVYGILHDQVTVRVCIEYFTIGHPPLVESDDPTVQAFAWGIVATWWVGLLLGIPLAIAVCAGSRPKRSVGTLVKPIAVLMAISGIAAVTAGLTGWMLAANDAVVLVGPIADTVPAEKHVPFLADLLAHSASYFFGFVGGLVVCTQIWRSRGRTECVAR